METNENRDLLDVYVRLCAEPAWYERYFRCGKKFDGSVFKCLTTNYRDLSSFPYYFNAFSSYAGVRRSEWPKKETTGQEIAKQYVANLLGVSFYYSKRLQDGDIVYDMTSRGLEFKRMLEAGFAEESEQKLMIFLFVMTGSFSYVPRYVLKRARTVYECWARAGISPEKIREDIRVFMREQAGEHTVEGIFRYDIVWEVGFFSDVEFLRLFFASSEEERTALKEAAVRNYVSGVKSDVLAYKYKQTNFQRPALVDTLIMLYVAYDILRFDNGGAREFYETVVGDFSKLIDIDTEKVMGFIEQYNDVFSVIFCSAVSEEDDFTERFSAFLEEEPAEVAEEKIDFTSVKGVKKLVAMNSLLKRQAKEHSGYRCAMEEYHNCNGFYFTGKEDGKNFLEIHHFIPREFSYAFENSIEFLDNYVPLCPRCHRLIHRAVDRERKGTINYLFRQRADALKAHGIEVDLRKIYKFYRIEDGR